VVNCVGILSSWCDFRSDWVWNISGWSVSLPSHGGQGGSLVPPYTRGSVSLSLFLTSHAHFAYPPSRLPEGDGDITKREQTMFHL